MEAVLLLTQGALILRLLTTMLLLIKIVVVLIVVRIMVVVVTLAALPLGKVLRLVILVGMQLQAQLSLLNWNAVNTASTYTLTHNGSGSFTSLTVTPTITNGLATYTFTNTSSTHFQHGTTYTFKLEANCVSTNGDSCGVSSEEITSHEFVVI